MKNQVGILEDFKKICKEHSICEKCPIKDKEHVCLFNKFPSDWNKKDMEVFEGVLNTIITKEEKKGEPTANAQRNKTKNG